MARARDPNRARAYEIWQKHDGNITNRQIADQLGINEKVISVWKQRDKWNVVQQSDSNVVQQTKQTKKSRYTAPKGNQFAKGNKGGSPAKRNKNAEKHGLFSKYLPSEALEIMQEIESKSPIDLLWDQIMIQYTAIIRAQRIMYVQDQADETKTTIEERSGKVSGTKWEVQHAWDKQATFLQAQSRAMSSLQSMIKQYEDMSKGDEERMLRIQKLKLEVKDLSGESDGDAHQQGSGYAEALNAQATDVFADEVDHGEETQENDIV